MRTWGDGCTQTTAFSRRGVRSGALPSPRLLLSWCSDLDTTDQPSTSWPRACTTRHALQLPQPWVNGSDKTRRPGLTSRAASYLLYNYTTGTSTCSYQPTARFRWCVSPLIFLVYPFSKHSCTVVRLHQMIEQSRWFDQKATTHEDEGRATTATDFVNRAFSGSGVRVTKLHSSCSLNGAGPWWKETPSPWRGSLGRTGPLSYFFPLNWIFAILQSSYISGLIGNQKRFVLDLITINKSKVFS